MGFIPVVSPTSCNFEGYKCSFQTDSLPKAGENFSNRNMPLLKISPSINETLLSIDEEEHRLITLKYSCPSIKKRGPILINISITNRQIFGCIDNWIQGGYSHNFKCILRSRKTNESYSLVPISTTNSYEGCGPLVFKMDETKEFPCYFLAKVPPGIYELSVGLDKLSVWARERKTIEILDGEIDESKIFSKVGNIEE
jgi:hypothetical protein